MANDLRYVARFQLDGQNFKFVEPTLSALKVRLMEFTELPQHCFDRVTLREPNQIIIFGSEIQHRYGIARIQSSLEHAQ